MAETNTRTHRLQQPETFLKGCYLPPMEKQRQRKKTGPAMALRAMDINRPRWQRRNDFTQKPW